MGNITDDGLLKVGDLKYAPKDGELKRLMLEDGDLLFNRTNSAEKVCKAAVFHEAQEIGSRRTSSASGSIPLLRILTS